MVSIVFSVRNKVFTITFNFLCFFSKYFLKPHDESPLITKLNQRIKKKFYYRRKDPAGFEPGDLGVTGVLL